MARAERHVLMLQEVAEVGMDMARNLQLEALYQRAADTPTGTTVRRVGEDFGQSFDRIAGAVTRTLALEAQIAEALAVQKREARRLAWRAERELAKQVASQSATKPAAPAPDKPEISAEPPAPAAKEPTRH